MIRKRNLRRLFENEAKTIAAMLAHSLVLLAVTLMRSVSSTCTPVSPGFFTNFQTASGSCVRFTNSVFSQCRHTGSLDWVYGGAICYDQSSGEFELSSCTFFECSTYVSMFKDYGGCAYLKASRIEIERCCGQRCYSEVGQAFCFVGCASPNVHFSTFVNCSTSGDGNADYGALSDDLETSAAISLLLLNVNFSGCYSCVEVLLFPSMGVHPVVGLIASFQSTVLRRLRRSIFQGAGQRRSDIRHFSIIQIRVVRFMRILV
jgi:hypothetical protein